MASDSRPERTRDAARTKQRLLDAARDEFAEYGIAGGRVERIAAAARCNKALIYAYFDSKDALFDAAFAAHVQAHLDRVNFDGTDLPAYAGRLFDIFEDDPTVIRLASWYRLERSGSPGQAAVLTALANAANMLGTFAGGWLQHKGAPRWAMIAAGSLIMGMASLAIFAPALPFGLPASGGTLATESLQNALMALTSVSTVPGAFLTVLPTATGYTVIFQGALVSDPPLRQVVSRTYEAGLRGIVPVGDGKIDWKVGAYRTDVASALAGSSD